MSDIQVIKCNENGVEVWRYGGQVIRRGADSILLEAFFNRADLLFHGILLRRGDRFREIYYSNRWYNIFEIHDCDDDRLKAWYCNITRPAEFMDGHISYSDLALDLLVLPDGQQLVLDEDEFAALHLDAATQQQAWQALAELQALFTQGSAVIKSLSQKDGTDFANL